MTAKVLHAVLLRAGGRAGLVVALNNMHDAYREVMEARARGELPGEATSGAAATDELAGRGWGRGKSARAGHAGHCGSGRVGTASGGRPMTNAPDVTNAAEDGAALLDAVDRFLGRYIIYPSEHTRIPHVLWCAHTQLMDCLESTPRLYFKSPEQAAVRPGRWKSRNTLSRTACWL